MVKVENGKITATSLPKHGYIDGRFVSTMATVPAEDLKRNGWHEPIHDKPEYDPAYEQLSAPSYSYDKKADTVTASYTVIEKPEAVLKRRIDELEATLIKTDETAEELKAALISKDVIREADLTVAKEK